MLQRPQKPSGSSKKATHTEFFVYLVIHNPSASILSGSRKSKLGPHNYPCRDALQRACRHNSYHNGNANSHCTYCQSCQELLNTHISNPSCPLTQVGQFLSILFQPTQFQRNRKSAASSGKQRKLLYFQHKRPKRKGPNSSACVLSGKPEFSRIFYYLNTQKCSSFHLPQLPLYTTSTRPS